MAKRFLAFGSELIYWVCITVIIQISTRLKTLELIISKQWPWHAVTWCSGCELGESLLHSTVQCRSDEHHVHTPMCKIHAIQTEQLETQQEAFRARSHFITPECTAQEASSCTGTLDHETHHCYTLAWAWKNPAALHKSTAFSHFNCFIKMWTCCCLLHLTSKNKILLVA